MHRVVKKINEDFERKRYCSAAFLDISQAFDKVWHKGLLYKLKANLPHHYYEILRSYLTGRWFFVQQQDEQSSLHKIQSGVPQGSVLGPVLYLLFTADLPLTRNATTATFADDTAILASHVNADVASKLLQNNINKVQKWLTKWRLKANEKKSAHVTFTTRKETCPPIFLNNHQLPQAENAKYLGIYLDRRLTWRKHIFTKRKQLGLKLRQLYWIIGRKSQLSLDNKLLLYKTILKPIWTYGIQLWGTASSSNLEILQRFQNKVMRMICNAPYYVPNFIIERDLEVNTIREEIKKTSAKYAERLEEHPNRLARSLWNDDNDMRRLKRFKPSDLTTRW